MKTEILEWRSYFNEVCVLKIRYLGPTIFNNFIIFSCVSRCACMFKFLLFSQFLRRKMRLIKNHVSRLLWSACTDNLPKYNSLFSIWMYDVKDSVWWCRILYLEIWLTYYLRQEKTHFYSNNQVDSAGRWNANICRL